MPTPRDLLVQLILDVFRVHALPWDNTADAKMDHLVGHLRNAFTPIGSVEELEQLLHTDLVSREAQRWAVVYLRPPVREERLVPLLAGWFDFAGKWPVLRLQVALFSLDASDHLVSSGFRFETPEGPDRAGRHDFYHVQPINAFAGQSLTAAPASSSTPATPLDAHDPIALVLCLLVSLYGTDGITSLSPDTRNLVLAQINGLRVVRHRPRYFRVTQGARTIVCCSRSEDAIGRVRERYQAAPVSQCAVTEYDGASEDDRDFLPES